MPRFLRGILPNEPVWPETMRTSRTNPANRISHIASNGLVSLSPSEMLMSSADGAISQLTVSLHA
jgi:hypothetical protein